MPVGAGFQAFVLDLLAPLQPGARRMFGGVGIMRDGLMFALLSHDTIYFRVDALTRKSFQDAGSGPFRYHRAGREVAIETYYAVPDAMYDEPEALLACAREALGAARRNPGRRRRPAAR